MSLKVRISVLMCTEGERLGFMRWAVRRELVRVDSLTGQETVIFFEQI